MVRGRDREDDTTVVDGKICDVEGGKDEGKVLGVERREENCRVRGREGAGVTVAGEPCEDTGICVTCEDGVSGVFDAEFDDITCVFVAVHSQGACLL